MKKMFFVFFSSTENISYTLSIFLEIGFDTMSRRIWYAQKLRCLVIPLKRISLYILSDA